MNLKYCHTSITDRGREGPTDGRDNLGVRADEKKLALGLSAGDGEMLIDPGKPTK